MPVVDGHIRCYRCGETKPLSEYQPSVVKAGCGECRSCKYARKRAYEKRNPKKAAKARRSHRARNIEKDRATRRAYYATKREAHRDWALAGRYGITAAEYEAILAAQGGCCACCGATANRNGKRLFVDHDHASGAVRGIICHRCNAGIGALGDTIEGVRRALSYLERAAQQPPRRALPALRINLLQGAN